MPALHRALFVLVFLGLTLAAPAPGAEQLLLADPSSEQLPLFEAPPAPFNFLQCPSFTVRCVKDNKWPSGIVGNIGPQPFVRVGLRCNQAHEKRNTRECNAVFPDECEDNCFAYGPVPF
ncbi:hypothetical protein RQP46_000861 [Phenoliferia psychrophenolica]